MCKVNIGSSNPLKHTDIKLKKYMFAAEPIEF